MNKEITELADCLTKSKTAYNFVDELSHRQGIEIIDGTYSTLLANHTYLVKISSSACILIKTPRQVTKGMGFNIFAAHTDSPALKLKPHFLLKDEHYTRLSTEVYGGPIISSWLDIPLTLAGRVFIKDGETTTEKIINLKEPLFTIPNMPPHLETNINKGFIYNPQIDLLALAPKDFSLEKYLDVPENSILGHDLFLVPAMDAKIIGDDFIFANRIDDLACVYVGLKAFIDSVPQDKINILCCFDNEEVGSRTKQGADSTHLNDMLDLIYESFAYSQVDKLNALSHSFMISADNAHAVNPNHIEKFDSLNKTYLNEGVVIKYNANQSYTSDGLSSAYFKSLCQSIDAPYQEFANRSDMRGGSTLGNIALSHVSIPSVDIGLPQLAMHSTMEVLGQKDVVEAIRIISAYFNR